MNAETLDIFSSHRGLKSLLNSRHRNVVLVWRRRRGLLWLVTPARGWKTSQLSRLFSHSFQCCLRNLHFVFETQETTHETRRKEKHHADRITTPPRCVHVADHPHPNPTISRYLGSISLAPSNGSGGRIVRY